MFFFSFFTTPGRAGSGFLEWGTISRGTKQHGTCGKDYQLAMVVVEGSDIFTGPRVVKLVVAYRRRKKQGTGS